MGFFEFLTFIKIALCFCYFQIVPNLIYVPPSGHSKVYLVHYSPTVLVNLDSGLSSTQVSVSVSLKSSWKHI